jgi:predicted acetyltransferase
VPAVNDVMSELRLRPLRDDDETVVRQANLELAPDNFDFALGLTPETDWSTFKQTKVEQHLGVDLPEGYVPASFLLATVNDELVGRVSIRHELNERLLAEGGNIGYAVLPAFRRHGFATEILRQALIVARAHGVDRALLTCADDNLASAAVIERCGGVLDEGWPIVQVDGPPSRRYWID